MIICTIIICRKINETPGKRCSSSKLSLTQRIRSAFVQSDKPGLRCGDSVPIIDKQKASALEQEADANLIIQGLDKIKCGQVQPFDNPRRPNAAMGAPCKGTRPSARHEQNKPALETFAALQEKQRMEEKSKRMEHEKTHMMSVSESTGTQEVANKRRKRKNEPTKVDVE